jgi:hypothetical protein
MVFLRGAMHTKGGKMKRDKVAKRDGKVFRTFNIEEEHSFLSDKYGLIIPNPVIEITVTGLLVVMRLEPEETQTGIIPSFLFRWDEKALALDIDPENASEDEKNKFKAGHAEYSGHHTKRVNLDQWLFEINIIWNGEKIYCGQINFNLDREIELSGTVKPYGDLKIV